MNCKIIGSGGFNNVYEKEVGGLNVYKIPRNENLHYRIIEVISIELYKFIKNKNKGFLIPNTKFVNINTDKIGNIRVIQRKIKGDILTHKNIVDVSRDDFEQLIQLYFEVKEKYNFEIDFVGPKGITASNNFKEPIFENILIKNGKMHLVDLGGMSLGGCRCNIYNLLEFGKIIGIKENLRTRLEYEYLKIAENTDMKNKGLMFYDFLKIEIKNRYDKIMSTT